MTNYVFYLFIIVCLSVVLHKYIFVTINLSGLKGEIRYILYLR